MTTLQIIIVIAIALIAITIGLIALRFSNFREWLVWAVSEAERSLGGGTGDLKLKYAYDLAIKAFPKLTKSIPFPLFKAFIKTALIVMNRMIENNKKIAEAITWEPIAIDGNIIQTGTISTNVSAQ